MNRIRRQTGSLGPLGMACAALLALAAPCLGQVRVEVEAVAGRPLGLGRVTIQADRRARPRLSWQVGLSDRQRRVLHVAQEPPADGALRGTVRELVPPRRRTVYFLFRGDEPLELNIEAGGQYQQRAAPRHDPRAWARLRDAWWEQYRESLRGAGGGDYPPLVEHYLTHVLARKLGIPLAAPRDAPSAWSGLRSQLDLLAGTERYRLEIHRRLLSGTPAGDAERLPLPAEEPAPAVEAESDAPVDVEPIALHVPAECFYLRCGSFENFSWLRARLDEWGGGARNLVAQRAIDYDLSQKLERQIALKETALSKLLGPAVIADVAIVGLDPFVREGAAVGLLFQARNNLALSANFLQQRQEALRATPGAAEQKLKIAGRDVSLIATADNRLRSFYAVDGDFHLVATSSHLVERFFAAGKGERTLGRTVGFRSLRRAMPTSRGDALFACLSTEFFANLTSARYQIEMRRRAESAAEMELLELARLLAAAEGYAGREVAALVEGGYLPAGFGGRGDGSALVDSGGAVRDSRRGPRGSMVPVPDVAMRDATAAELDEVEQLQRLVAQWGPPVPLVLGIGRREGPRPELERLVVDAQLAPLAREQFQLFAGLLGPAVDQRLVPLGKDVVAFQASLQGAAAGGAEAYQLFGALRDADPRAVQEPSLMALLGPLLGIEQIQGYLGAWPHPGALRLLGIGDARTDAQGYARLLGGLWLRRVEGFTVLSFHSDVLAEVTGQLRFEPVPRPAQAWLRAGDLAQSKLAPLVNYWGYRRAREMSAGNARLLDQLSGPLGVPRELCPETAERLLGGRLICPLGGQYVYQAELGRWASSQWRPRRLLEREAPAGYQFPALQWIRGLSAEVRLLEGSLGAHLEADLPREVAPRAEPAGPREL